MKTLDIPTQTESFLISQNNYQAIQQPDTIIKKDTNYVFDISSSMLYLVFRNTLTNNNISRKFVYVTYQDNKYITNDTCYVYFENKKYFFDIGVEVNDVIHIINYFIRYINGNTMLDNNVTNLLEKYLVKQ